MNGTFVGYYEAGIAPCAFDITACVKEGENVVCVATDNCAARGTKIFTHETVPGHDPGDMSGVPYQWNTTDFNEVQGGLVGNVALVVKPSKTYLTLPYYNNLKTVGTYVTAKDFDMGKVAFRPFTFAEYRTYKPYPWRIKKYSSFEWDCIKLPAGPSGRNSSLIQPMLMGISARSREQRLAWEQKKKKHELKVLSDNKLATPLLIAKKYIEEKYGAY